MIEMISAARFSLLTNLLATFLLVGLVSCSARKTAIAIDATRPDAVAYAEETSSRTLIILYDSTIGKAPLMRAIEEYGSRLIYDYTMLSGVAVSVPDGKTLQQATEYYSKVEGVLSVQRDQVMQLQ